MLKGYRIALVEDDEFMGNSLEQRLTLEGAEVVWLKRIKRAIGALRTPVAPIHVVICDIKLPDGSGEELYNTLCQTTDPPPFLFVTGHGDVEQAVRLMQAGAVDYVTKPFSISVFLDRLVMLLSSGEQQEFPPITGISAAARRVDSLALKAAKTGRPVLIRGGPGMGKALIAQRIHDTSDRRAAPFVNINLDRVPDVHAALFGPDGAVARVGEGTLFLHTLSRLPDASQSALLDVLQSGFDGCIIATCGLDKQATSTQSGFRSELFDLIGMMEIVVPPLGERTLDAVWLMGQLFETLNHRRETPLQGISRLSEEAARSYDWPGGGRELRTRLRAATENATGEFLQPADLFPERMTSDDRIMTLAEARDIAERRQIVDALVRSGGRVGKAAKILQVSRTTLWQKMQKLEIPSGSD